MSLHLPMVGREEELRTLSASLREVAHGDGKLILIAGEAGIGKTRLVIEFQELAASEGAWVMIGRCLPGAPTPYLPFIDAFDDYAESTSKRGSMNSKTFKMTAGELGLLGWIKGTRASDTPELRPESEKGRTIYTVRELLRRVSKKHPVLVVLEDLQWADSASIQLLHFLARNLRDLRLLLLGTYRPEDLSIEGGERLHVLVESLRVMRREGIPHELTLQRLRPDEVKFAVEGLLGAPLGAELLRRIASDSGGNPLFAIELTRMLLQSDSVKLIGGQWQAIGKEKLDLPPTVREVILSRIDRLTDEKRRVLECAAVIGEWFDPKVLSDVLELEELRCLEILDSIDRNHQLVKAYEGRFCFVHEKIRQVTYDQISSPRRKKLHEITASVLERREPDERLYGLLSHHFAMAAKASECVKYSLLAGKNALKKYALKEAASSFGTVLEAVGTDPAFSDEKLQALEGLGDSYLFGGLYGSAARQYDRFLALCHESRDRARVLAKAGESCLDTSKASEMLHEAERCEGVEPIVLGEIKMSLGNLASLRRRAYTEAEVLYQEAQQVFRARGAKEELAIAIMRHSNVKIKQGHLEDALGMARESEVISSEIGSPLGEELAAMTLGRIYYCMGLTKEAIQSFSKAIEIGERSNDYEASSSAYTLKSMVNFAMDDFESALREARKASECASMIEGFPVRAGARVFLALCSICHGELTEGERILTDSSEWKKLDIETEPERITQSWWSPYSWISLAWGELYSAKGDWNAGRRAFLRSIDNLQNPRWLAYPVDEAIYRTRFGHALAKHGYREEANEQFRQALKVYLKLRNQPQAQRLKTLFETVN